MGKALGYLRVVGEELLGLVEETLAPPSSSPLRFLAALTVSLSSPVSAVKAPSGMPPAIKSRVAPTRLLPHLR